MAFKFIDLFCGIGGFRVALEKEGGKCVFSSDIDEKAREAYERNFNEKPSGDITKIDTKDIPDHDILCAGFPCQPFSLAGNQKGFEDEKNGNLFFEILRIAKAKEPNILLLENVAGIGYGKMRPYLNEIRMQLNKIDYVVYNEILNLSQFGVPQSRNRMYFVAFNKYYLRRFDVNYFEFPKPTFKHVRLSEYLDKEIDKTTICKRQIEDVKVTRNIEQFDFGFGRSEPYWLFSFSEKVHQQKVKVYSTDFCSPCIITEKYNVIIYDRGIIRYLSHTECKKLMTFSRFHKVSEGGAGYKQLGNSVSPFMIQEIYKATRRFLDIY